MKNIGVPTLRKNEKRCLCHLRKKCFRGEIACNISYAGKTLKTKAFVFKNNKLNLLGAD